MKVAIVLLAVVAVVISDNCDSHRECQQHHTTLCSGASHGRVICTSTHVCTCVTANNGTGHGNIKCSTQLQCTSDNHHCPNNENEHCVDNVCHCEHQRPNGGHGGHAGVLG